MVSQRDVPVGGGIAHGEVALTFDDGPWPVQTGQVVHILERLHVPATFFMVGYLVARYLGIVRMVANAGMRIGDHSSDHPIDPPLADLTPQRVAEEIGRTADALAALGVGPALFRPPGGSYDDAVLHEAERQGMRLVTWSVDPKTGAPTHRRARSSTGCSAPFGPDPSCSCTTAEAIGGDDPRASKDHPRHPQDGFPPCRDPRQCLKGDERANAEILACLDLLADPSRRPGMARVGINVNRALGVSVPHLRRLARGYRSDHPLALDLWRTGVHEARILASMVDDPAQVTPEQMEAWVLDFDSWDVCDQVCGNLFESAPSGMKIARGWMSRPEEFVKRAGFALVAEHAVHDRTSADRVFTGW